MLNKMPWVIHFSDIVFFARRKRFKHAFKLAKIYTRYRIHKIIDRML
jgi:hypothetical protein